jgi:beta-carotene ketolase (CrtW type)
LRPGPLAPQVRRGQILALLIAAAWFTSLAVGLWLPWRHLPLGELAVLVLVVVPVRTLLQTGLFIVAHDAMHRLLVPRREPLNDRLGALALALYGALPYGRCRRQHGLHHHHAGGPHDPDGPGVGSPWLPAWYGRFMGRYLNPGQMALLLVAWGLLAWATSIQAVLLVCTLPLLLSSLQLFVVGTYLPHRRQAHDWDGSTLDGSMADQAVISLALPEWLSLLACFHFGYHREHHQAPQLGWHQLPAQRRRNRVVSLATAEAPH